MELYDYEAQCKDWKDEIVGTEEIGEKLSKRMYTTEDYYNTGWRMVRHGILILDFKGNIISANPYFCEKIGYTYEEMTGKNVNEFCVKADDLYASDSINIFTLLQSINQQTTNQCEVNTKDQKLYRVRWVANRIPSDLNFPFAHSIVHVYFLAESSYTKLTDAAAKMAKKETDKLEIILNSKIVRIGVILVIILSALNGSLSGILTKFLDLF